MISAEEIKRYLPFYLNAESQKKLFDELKDFPNNLWKIFSSYPYDDFSIYQGDGFRDMLLVNLPRPEIGRGSAMILSNTCDTDQSNIRLSEIRMLYAPIFNLDKYKRLLLKNAMSSVTSINHHIEQIKKQHLSHIFYLPSHQDLDYEGIVFFDRMNNCPASIVSKDEIKAKRLFGLSNYGFYILLVKLSIHFTRIREGVDRDIASFSLMGEENSSCQI